MNILVVCTGNICRSPTAEAVLRKKLVVAGLGDKVRIDSAGTHGLHVGQMPDQRSAAVARSRGYDLSKIRSRQFKDDDYENFDVILAMDEGHLRTLMSNKPDSTGASLMLYLKFSQTHPSESVPDPYYGGDQGFEQVLDMIEEGADTLINHWYPQSL